MIILGLDPGVARLGYGVIASERGVDRCVTMGVLETPKGEIGPRLLDLHQHLQELIAEHQPDATCVERLFFSKNVSTAIVVAQARGVILLTCAASGILVVEASPQDVKQAVAGYGSADKRQVQRMVQALLRLPEIPQPDDAADALAMALYGVRAAAMAKRQ
ncbi:crossover junction endodeoxyribonuclease RuvC [Candidatus Uhrbacteria bacterium]|nr:crossover junction endodeoxyribonuclease RuvC [Candidatus Uhrbacteria bacterium]